MRGSAREGGGLSTLNFHLSTFRDCADIRAARVRALAEGRTHVAFEDIRHFAPEVLGHRVLLNYDGLAENLSVPTLVAEFAKLVPQE